MCAVPLAIAAVFSLLAWLAANPRSDKNSTRRALLKEKLEYLKTRREALRAELDGLHSPVPEDPDRAKNRRTSI